MDRPGTGPSSYQLPQQQPQNQSDYEIQPQEYHYEATHEIIATGDHEAALTYEPNYYVEGNQPDQCCQPEQPNNLQAQQQLQPPQQPRQQQQPTQFPPPQTNLQADGAQPPKPILMQQNNVQTYQNGQNQPGAYPPQAMPAQPVNFQPASPQNNQMYQNGIPAKPEQQFPPQSPRKSPVFQNLSPAYQQQGQSIPVHFPPPGQNFHQGQGVQFQQPQVQYVAAGSVPGIPLQKPGPQPTPGIQNGWTSGLFDCMNDPMNALITLLFPCLTFGQIAEIIDEGQTSCATSGMLYGAIAFCIAVPCIMSCTYRTKLRSKFGLPEAPAPDWITHFLCEYCAICQEYRELQTRGWDPSIGWQGNLARNHNMNQQQVAMMPPMNQRMMG